MLLDLIELNFLYLAVSGSARRPIPLTKKRRPDAVRLVSSSSFRLLRSCLRHCAAWHFGPNHDELLI